MLKPYRAHAFRSSGFTMIELLTVMGIIVILMSILLPVVSTIRRKAQEADTKALLGRLATACNSYFTDQGAYPGPVPESVIYGGTGGTSGNSAWKLVLRTSGTGSNSVLGSSITYVTSSENLVLGLVGGLTPNPTAPTDPTQVVYDPTLIPNGPQSLNPINPRQFTSYIDPKKGDLHDDGVGNYSSAATQGPVGSLMIPEFMDRFSVPQPIIYLRAMTGAQGIVDSGSATVGNFSQYYSTEMLPYNFTFPISGGITDPGNGQVYWTGGAAVWFLNPSLNIFTIGSNNPNPVARGKDSYILISAGYDGIYGTSDDIIISD